MSNGHILGPRPTHYLSTSTQHITAVGDAIQPSAGHVYLTATTGAKTLTSTPTIPPGVNGQLLIITSGHVSGIALQDNGTLPGSGVALNAASVSLGSRDSIVLVYNSAEGLWLQVAFQGSAL